MEPQTAQIRAEIERISYRNEENGWTVLKARNFDDDTTVTATGHFPAIHAGEQFELFGTWSKHPQYGSQFKIERSVPLRPSTGPAIERYLSSGLIHGIGPKTAARIVSHFGDQTLEILDETPRKLLEVSSIGMKKAEAIIESWQEQRAVANVMMFLNRHGISPLFAARIFKLYGAESISTVSSDPYRLASDVQGIGFISADKVARSMGIAADSKERVRAAILYQLQQAEERGHCYVTTPQLLTMLQEGLELSESQIIPKLADCLSHLNEVGALISEKMIVNDAQGTPIQTSAHYRSELYVAEVNISQQVRSLLGEHLNVDHERVNTWLERYAEATGAPLSEEQIEAVRKAVSSRVFILTGGPGVGKTTTANAIIRLFKAMGKSVALGAPTGRAAQRLTEVAAAPARTIHRMLEWLPHLHTFSRDETNPLTVQAVIIDEASMLDIRLADALIRAVPRNAQLILIGDVDQLPSVGPGNVLRDLIDSGEVPFTRLSRIFRQAAHSKIVQAAHAINHGEDPQFSNEPRSDCQFIEVDTGEDIKQVLKELVTRRLPRDYGFNPLTDVQVLTPMNRGELGTQSLNDELQALLNPQRSSLHEFKRGNLVLRPGDKVIQSSNNYDLGVFNGDIGFVQQTKVDGGRLIISFGDRVVTYEDEQAMDLRLAYAITIHKSQGSEFPAVIIPCSMQHFVMLQRNLIYTALTRARKLAIFIGSKRALQQAARNQSSLKRQTTLIDKLKKTAE